MPFDVELDADRMKHDSAEVSDRTGLRGDARGTPVGAISKQWRAGAGRVQSELMCPSGDWNELDERRVFGRRQDLEPGNGGFAFGAERRSSKRAARVAADRTFDEPLTDQTASSDGHVAFEESPFFGRPFDRSSGFRR